MNLKNFDTHAFSAYHSKNLGVNLNSFTYRMAGNNVRRRGVWPTVCICIQDLDELFHVNFAYHEPSKSFVISIWLAKSQNVASRYRANFIFIGDNSKLCFDGLKVSSVEYAPSIDKCMEDTESISLCLPRNLAKKICVKTQKEGLGEWSEVECLAVEVFFEKV